VDGTSSALFTETPGCSQQKNFTEHTFLKTLIVQMQREATTDQQTLGGQCCQVLNYLAWVSACSQENNLTEKNTTSLAALQSNTVIIKELSILKIYT
jgi:hypothetical protein